MRTQKLIETIKLAKNLGMTQVIIFNPDDVVIPPYIKEKGILLEI